MAANQKWAHEAVGVGGSDPPGHNWTGRGPRELRPHVSASAHGRRQDRRSGPDGTGCLPKPTVGVLRGPTEVTARARGDETKQSRRPNIL